MVCRDYWPPGKTSNHSFLVRKPEDGILGPGITSLASEMVGFDVMCSKCKRLIKESFHRQALKTREKLLVMLSVTRLPLSLIKRTVLSKGREGLKLMQSFFRRFLSEPTDIGDKRIHLLQLQQTCLSESPENNSGRVTRVVTTPSINAKMTHLFRRCYSTGVDGILRTVPEPALDLTKIEASDVAAIRLCLLLGKTHI